LLLLAFVGGYKTSKTLRATQYNPLGIWFCSWLFSFSQIGRSDQKVVLFLRFLLLLLSLLYSFSLSLSFDAFVFSFSFLIFLS
jgi:hypothetical protein